MSDVWHRFAGTSVKGKFRALDMERLSTLMNSLEGKRIEVAIRPEKASRTLPQNAKIHVLVREVARESGETELRTKRRATLEALGLERGTTKETVLGREIYEVRHTSDLSKEEMSLVIDKLLDQCRFLGIVPPRDAEIEVMA